MALDTNEVINLYFNNSNANSRIEKLILSYASLKLKLDNIEEQSWYFKKALPSEQSKLEDIYCNYAHLRKFYNQNSSDDLFQKLTEYNNQKNKLLIKGIRSVNMGYFFRFTIEKISYFEELLALKTKVEKLKPIDWYLDHEEDLLRVMG